MTQHGGREFQSQNCSGRTKIMVRDKIKRQSSQQLKQNVPQKKSSQQNLKY